MDHLEFATQRLRSLQTMQACLIELKLMRDALRFDRALRDHWFALKYGYNPNQPRVPRGQREGGQWVDDGGSSGRIVLAGDIPTNDTPEVPKERPPTTRARNLAVRQLARRLGPYISVFVDAGSWIYDHKAEITSYFDSPKSLDELLNAAKDPQAGYDIHHIVERNSAATDGSEAGLINAPENKAAIPRWKHWELNGWYEKESKDLGGQSPREYLKGKSWEERREVGLQGLRQVGVLKP